MITDTDTDPTGFEDQPIRKVLESWIYTGEGMFGEIVYDAEREIVKRLREVSSYLFENKSIPMPDWAKAVCASCGKEVYKGDKCDHKQDNTP